MSDALAGLASSTDPDLLVGFETADDAAVYRLSDTVAMISTVDFITPPVDDPYWFGQISAANAISDVYSMGGRPLTALNVVMFPAKQLDLGLLKEILAGGHDKVREAGASLAGGHTVDDNEPKYGLCVNGVVHPDRIIKNCGAQAGDALILTKPLGSGVLFNAVRAGKFPYPELERTTLPALAALNGPAMEAALKFTLHAATDITGFGISGHALEMAVGSCCRLNIRYHALPFFDGALAMYRKGQSTGSNKANRQLTAGRLDLPDNLSTAEQELLFDPQTSGGLLLSVPLAEKESLLSALHQAGVSSAVAIGEVTAGTPQVIIS